MGGGARPLYGFPNHNRELWQGIAAYIKIGEGKLSVYLFETGSLTTKNIIVICLQFTGLSPVMQLFILVKKLCWCKVTKIFRTAFQSLSVGWHMFFWKVLLWHACISLICNNDLWLRLFFPRTRKYIQKLLDDYCGAVEKLPATKKCPLGKAVYILGSHKVLSVYLYVWLPVSVLGQDKGFRVKYAYAWRSSPRRGLRELRKAEGYIWPYIPSRVLIRTV